MYIIVLLYHMHSKIKYTVWLILLSPLFTQAQLQADNWVFSNNGYYINFNRATQPLSLLNPGYANTRGTTYSDRNGQLLFYSNGSIVCNRDFNKMPSTAGSNYLFSNGLYYTQGVLAVPYPDHDSLYILFHIYSDFSNNLKSELLYSIINMKMDSGRGGVDLVQRNIPIFGPLFSGTNVLFKLTAIQHCNKKDIWVVGHDANSDKYFSLLVTASGVSNTAIYSTGNFIPSVNYPDTVNHPNLDGSIKISPLGNRIVASYKGQNFIEIGDFNTQTGIVSGIKKIVAAPPPSDTIYNPNYIHRFVYGPIGVEFSPTGDRLYVSSNYEVMDISGNPYFTGFLYQFDASLPTQVQIQNSKYFIDSTINFRDGALQLADNGKVYLNVDDALSEIANPENLGATCNYTRLLVGQPNGSAPGRSLPNIMQSYLRYPVITTGNCQFQNISFSIQNPVGISSISWNFGDPASGVNNISNSFTPTHIFSSAGIYQVKAVLQNTNGCSADTIIKVVSAGPFKVFLGNDTTACQGDTVVLHMNIPYASNLWSTNSIDTSIKITQPGTYWVKVNLGDCFASDTIVIAFRNLPQFTLGPDTVICSTSSITLSPVPNYSNVSYLWSNNAITASNTVSMVGNYWLRITDNIGCKFRDSINISYSQLPNYNLGNDTSICQKDTLLLNASTNGATSYLWNTGLTTPGIKAFQGGIYWCDVIKDGCTYRDSIIIVVKPIPVVNIGADTTLCEDKTLLLDATNLNSTYLWQDGSISATYLVTQKGQYEVSVNMNGCIVKDAITIMYDLKPKFTLGPDRQFCIGTTLILDPKISNVNYLWQDGSLNRTYRVTEPGLYFLAASNYCGTTTDSIVLSKGVCELYVPNAFTPNGDTKNDVFKANYGDNVIEFQMQVLNRYGQLVFETRDKTKGWDGNYLGKPQPQGTYTWGIRYRTSMGQIWEDMKGTVILLR